MSRPAHLAAVAAVIAGLLVPSVATATAHLGDRPLRPGAHGHDVHVLQVLLRHAGAAVDIDGDFGPGTLRAVKAFQRGAQLPVSGVVGPKTIFLLRAAATARKGDDGALTGGATSGASPSTALPSTTAPAPATGASAAGASPASASAATDMWQAGAVDPAASVTPAATIGSDSLAYAPAGIPPVVAQLIASANKIATLPYRYGGGHGSFDDTAYDCSGSLSYALHGAGLLDGTMDSSELARWGEAGPGQWVTIYANASHTYLVVDGLRYDTGAQRANRADSRWGLPFSSNSGYHVRHPAGL